MIEVKTKEDQENRDMVQPSSNMGNITTWTLYLVF